MDRNLNDITSFGKKRPWKQKKSSSIVYAKYLYLLQYEKAQNVESCGNILFFAQSGSSMRLYQAWFCHSRLCPLCNWRRSRKQSYELQLILDEVMKQYPHGSFLFLTLTEKNATSQTLKAELKKMNESFYKLFQYKKVKKNILGYVRSTEITVNDKRHSYHQHAHVLLFVKSTYFRDMKNYITQSEWSKLWEKARKLNYLPIVNVKRVKPKVREREQSLVSAAYEVAKYQVKSSDYITGNEGRDLDVLETLEDALAHTRRISFGGLLKEVRKQMVLDFDEEHEDLISLGIDPSTGDKVDAVEYIWDEKKVNYVLNK